MREAENVVGCDAELFRSWDVRILGPTAHADDEMLGSHFFGLAFFDVGGQNCVLAFELDQLVQVFHLMQYIVLLNCQHRNTNLLLYNMIVLELNGEQFCNPS